MVIKMIIFEFVLILSLSSIARCFPSSKGDPNLNDQEQLIPQTDADNLDIEKPPPKNLTVTNFLKKLDFDPNSFNLDYAGLHEFCNFSNWELNNTHMKTDVSPRPEPNENLGEFTETNEAYGPDHEYETYQPDERNEVVQSQKSTGYFENGKSTGYFKDDKSTEYNLNGKSIEYYSDGKSTEYYPVGKSIEYSPDYNSIKPFHVDQTQFSNENKSSTHENRYFSDWSTSTPEKTTNHQNLTVDPRDMDHSDDDIFIRIVLILILMLQNIFLFVMVLFYRNLKKTNKNCLEQLRK